MEAMQVHHRLRIEQQDSYCGFVIRIQLNHSTMATLGWNYLADVEMWLLQGGFNKSKKHG